MPGVCEVCSSEQSKYRCPSCGLMSCSLACTQSHKIYCAPKPQSQSPQPANNDSNEPRIDANGHGPEKEDAAARKDDFDLKGLGSSKELQDLFTRYPQLKDQLREIYTTTLEEEWVQETPAYRGGRGRPFGRGRGGSSLRNRGPWTREKGFNRGLGKVRKLRGRCDEGLELGKTAEGFMQFVALIGGEKHEEGPA